MKTNSFALSKILFGEEMVIAIYLNNFLAC